MSRMTFKQRMLEADEARVVKLERRALKAGHPGDIYATLKVNGQTDMQRFTARGWEILSDNSSSFGQVVKVYFLRIPRDVLEARING